MLHQLNFIMPKRHLGKGSTKTQLQNVRFLCRFRRAKQIEIYLNIYKLTS